MTPEELKPIHDKLQEGLSPNQMAIREGIIIDVGEGQYDSYPRFPFQFFCWRSPECVKEMDAFIKYSTGKGCLLDVGAHLGIFSLVFSIINPNAIVHAFEPEKENCERMQEYCGNRNIICYEEALSDYNGKLQMFSYDGHLEKNRRLEAQQTTQVDCIMGDMFLKLGNIPDVIKIDVEGAELSVLNGFKETVIKYHPIIFLELHLKMLPENELNEIVRMISDWGYVIIDTQTDKLLSLDRLFKIDQNELRIILK